MTVIYKCDVCEEEYDSRMVVDPFNFHEFVLEGNRWVGVKLDICKQCQNSILEWIEVFKTRLREKKKIG